MLANNKRYDHVMLHNKIDCEEFKLQITDITAYKNGKFVESDKGNGKWSYAIPNTEGYELAKATCNSSSRNKDMVFDFRYLPEYIPLVKEIIRYVNEEQKKLANK